MVVRALTVTGAAGLMIAALWAAGLPPTVWFERVQGLLARADDTATGMVVPAAPTSMPTSAPTAASTPTDDTALAGTDSSLSPTPQKLHLVSTSPGRNARDGTAALGVDLKNPQTYGAGALLANGARLTEIHTDYVVLQRAGASMRLYRDGVATTPKDGQESDLLLVGGPAPEPAPIVTTHEVVTDYLRPSPVYDGQLIKGFVVYPGARTGVFSQLGLQAGDVITALNDTPFSDPTQAYELFRQLTSGVAMSATVERKGKVERLTLDGSHILADQERAKNPPVTTSAMPLGPPPS